MDIRAIETGEITQLELHEVKDGYIQDADFLADIILPAAHQIDGAYLDKESGLLNMHEDDVAWWIAWVHNEQAIYFARDAADDDIVAEDERLIATLGYDMELLQQKEMELFGLAHEHA